MGIYEIPKYTRKTQARKKRAIGESMEEKNDAIQLRDYGIAKMPDKTAFFIVKEIYGYTSRVYDGGTPHIQRLGTLYEIVFATGQTPRYLYVEGEDRLPLGDNHQYLRTIEFKQGINAETVPLRFEDRAAIKGIAAAQGCPIKTALTDQENAEIVWSEALNQHRAIEPLFFELTTGVSEEKVRDWDDAYCEDIVNEYLSENLQGDDTILTAYKIHVVKPEPQVVEPKYFMPSSPNAVIFTNTKTRKTSLANKVGDAVQRATAARMLGFSTADSVNPGLLHHRVAPIQFDEIVEEKNEDIWGTLLPYLEQGHTSIQRGKQSVDCDGHAAVIFASNPRAQPNGDLTSYDLFSSFLSCAQIITKNYSAFGSRLGFIVFGNSFKQCSGDAYPIEHTEKLAAIVQTLVFRARRPFALLFRDQRIRSWLNKPWPTEYLQFLQDAKFNSSLEFREFLSGQSEAYRHGRGAALRLACVKHLATLANGTLAVEDLLNEADAQLHIVTRINASSLRLLSDISQEKADAFFSAQFGAEPIHVKALCIAVKEFASKNVAKLRELKDRIPRPLLHDYVVEAINAVVEKGTKLSEAYLWERIEDRLNDVNQRLLGYGLEIQGSKAEREVKVVDLRRLAAVANA